MKNVNVSFSSSTDAAGMESNGFAPAGTRKIPVYDGPGPRVAYYASRKVYSRQGKEYIVTSKAYNPATRLTTATLEEVT